MKIFYLSIFFSALGLFHSPLSSAADICDVRLLSVSGGEDPKRLEAVSNKLNELYGFLQTWVTDRDLKGEIEFDCVVANNQSTFSVSYDEVDREKLAGKQGQSAPSLYHVFHEAMDGFEAKQGIPEKNRHSVLIKFLKR